MGIVANKKSGKSRGTIFYDTELHLLTTTATTVSDTLSIFSIMAFSNGKHGKCGKHVKLGK